MRSDSLEIPDEPAGTPEDARERYMRTARNLDPFPDIPSALLNSADIYDYVRATGMIHPFQRCRLSKPASYEVSIGRRYIYWDSKGKNVDRFLEENEEFVLAPNSIGFIAPDEFFRLPNYIAARFNLRITNVHRGLLLGTGPLVDPGFSGQLLVPLHNLTTNEYRFRRGEQFAWFEFTKLSPNTWDPRYEEMRRKYSLRGEFVPFPEEKLDIAQDPRRYLAEAAPEGVRSSIPEAIADSARSAKLASESADSARTEAAQSSIASEKARKTLFRIGIGAALVGFVAVVTLLATVIGLWYNSKQTANQVNELVVELGARYIDLKEQAEKERAALAQQVQTLARETAGLHNSALPQIQSQLDGLRAQVEGLRNRVGGGSSQQ